MAAGGNVEVTVKFEDVIVYFSKNEWKILEKWQKDLYCKVLADNFDALVFTGHPVTKSDILAWLERCEHLHVEGTCQPRARDSSGTLCATSGRVAQTCRNERVEQVWSLATIQESAKEDAAQYGDVGETERLYLSAGKQGNPIKEGPSPHTEYKKGGRGLASSTHSQRTVTTPTQYKCGECGKRFRLKALLRIHQKISMRNESFPCPKCGVRFPSPSHPRTHLQACAERGTDSFQETRLSRRHGNQALERLHCCADCGASFRRYLDLLRHQKSHDEAKPWPCPQCGAVFMYRSDLALHEESHLDEALHEYAACGENCLCECSLLLHFASHRGQGVGAGSPEPRGHEQLLPAACSKEEKPYSCAQCGLLFRLEVNLEVHYRYCHKEWLPKRGSNGAAQLPLSWPQKVHAEQTNNPSVLGGRQGDRWGSQHPSQPSAPHACADCGKCFVSKLKRCKHRRKHNAREPGGVAEQGSVGSVGPPKTAYVTKKLHKCQQCGDKFVYKWQLVAHLKGHGKDGCCLCTYCGEKFGCRSSLRKHHQRHREAAVSENGTSLEDFGAAATNRRTCATMRRYPCECGKHFPKFYLHIHQAFHAGVRYRCRVCGKVCNFKSAAVAHSKSHRGRWDVSNRPELKELSGSKPWCCTIEKIHLAPASQPHGQEGMSQPGEGFPPTYLYPECAEGISPQSRFPFEQRVSGREQSAQAEHRKKPRRKAKLKPASRHSLPKPFRCRDCGKDFAYFGRLVMHRRAHTGDFPFQCAECGKGFIHKCYLNLHWKIHAKESV
ncbi:zinc finger protein 835-like [Elgaria multicarinata webbii]|uniref:zinc finger protein 835-like n=1 Tax=Elgaria multicarinata webbii TaxID=159646 RepID=UPI002FCCCDC9